MHTFSGRSKKLCVLTLEVVPPYLYCIVQICELRSEINRHGTRCSGQVAATRDNGVCIPGIAFNARIGGVRMLDGQVTDVVEAKSLSLNPVCTMTQRM